MQPRLRITLPTRLALGLFIATAVIVTYLALTPTPPKAADLGWDKLNHLSAFTALMLLAGQAWPRHRRRAGLALLAHGGLIEILQTQVPGRSAEWGDLLADGVGIVLGLGLLGILAHLDRRLSAARTR